MLLHVCCGFAAGRSGKETSGPSTVSPFRRMALYNRSKRTNRYKKISHLKVGATTKDFMLHVAMSEGLHAQPKVLLSPGGESVACAHGLSLIHI